MEKNRRKLGKIKMINIILKFVIAGTVISVLQTVCLIQNDEISISALLVRVAVYTIITYAIMNLTYRLQVLEEQIYEILEKYNMRHHSIVKK